MTTPKTGIPELTSGQGNAPATVNSAFRVVDSYNAGDVISRTEKTPPTAATKGDTYIVAPSDATDAWAGYENQLAIYNVTPGADGVWSFREPTKGKFWYVEASAEWVRWTGSAWTEVTFASGGGGASGGSKKTNGFRLSVQSGVPVPTSDVSSAGTVYWVPGDGNEIALYDADDSVWNVHSSSELSIPAAGQSTGWNLVDVFAYADGGGNVALERLSWDGAADLRDLVRVTPLTWKDGVRVKSGDPTRRYVGSFFCFTSAADTTGITEDSRAKRYVWNRDNRAPRLMVVEFSPGGLSLQHGDLSDRASSRCTQDGVCDR